MASIDEIGVTEAIVGVVASSVVAGKAIDAVVVGVVTGIVTLGASLVVVGVTIDTAVVGVVTDTAALGVVTDTVVLGVAIDDALVGVANDTGVVIDVVTAFLSTVTLRWLFQLVELFLDGSKMGKSFFLLLAAFRLFFTMSSNSDSTISATDILDLSTGWLFLVGVRGISRFSSSSMKGTTLSWRRTSSSILSTILSAM